MLSRTRPLMFVWTGSGMVPLNLIMAQDQYTVGDAYRLAPFEERSTASHNHYYACVAEAWKNLPEMVAMRFSTADHLRKYALISTGYRDEKTIVVESNAAAQRMAAFMAPLDEFAVISAKEKVVIVWTAKSQSKAAMGHKDFQGSKEKVLELLSSMIDVSPDELKKNAGQSA